MAITAKAAVGLVGVVFVAIAIYASGWVSFTNTRIIDNDPLTSPVRVVQYAGRTIVLEDGRRIELLLNDYDFARSLQDSGHWIELQPAGDSNVYIYRKVPHYMSSIGGVPWTIPLFRTPDLPRYHRAFFDSGTFRK
jgi:hypothetical protein